LNKQIRLIALLTTIKLGIHNEKSFIVAFI